MDKLITFAVPCYNSAAYMDHCVETLLQALGHKTVAVDLPAHGKAGGDIAAQNLDTYVDCVVAELDRHEQPVILVGHSMGGAVITAAVCSRSRAALCR